MNAGQFGLISAECTYITLKDVCGDTLLPMMYTRCDAHVQYYARKRIGMLRTNGFNDVTYEVRYCMAEIIKKDTLINSRHLSNEDSAYHVSQLHRDVFKATIATRTPP